MTEIDLILKNAYVLTMDPSYTQYSDGAVAISGDKIIAVGEAKDICSTYASKETIDCQGRVLMPGLVNAHTHVPMTLLRGLADDLRLDVWLLGYMMPVERQFVSPEFVRLGTQIACIELIRSGVTTFNDMYYFESEVARASAEIGLRAVCGQSVLKFPTPDAIAYEESLEMARQFIEEWVNHPLIIPSIAPHAPYTCTDEILRACAKVAVTYDVPLHIHIAETAIEVENSLKQHNMTVVPYIQQAGLFDAKVIAAHCVQLDAGEIQLFKQYGVGVAHNPSSNLKLASGIAPVAQMLAAGLKVGIGTDGVASNNDQDMFEEIRLTSFLAKTSTNDPVAVPAKIALAMGTRIGAEALHMGHITGSLEPGKRADLILVDTNKLHHSPRFHRDPDGVYAQLVYSSKSTDVTDVMVNGSWVMRDQQVKNANETELMEHAMDYAKEIDRFLIKRERSVLSKLIAIAQASQEESFEVQVKAKITDTEKIIQMLAASEIEILYHRHYHQYDTYFIFEDQEQGMLRYREDVFVDADGETSKVRYRLTLIGANQEYVYPRDVLLSRSRFLASADHSLRFYRDYFRPHREIFIDKDRLRWRVLFRGLEYYVNIDRFDTPDLGTFIEVKSTTWSSRDAEYKSQTVVDLLHYLDASIEDIVREDYNQMVRRM